MNKKFIKTLISLICLMFAQNVYAEVEESVIVVTNVPYEASLTKKSSTNSATVDPATGVHSGLSTVFTLQTNGGDDHFDYIIKSYIDIDGDRVSAYGDDGRLLFAHETVPPTLAAVNNAKSGISPSKNVFAYPTQVNTTGGIRSEFKTNYKEYGNCYAIFIGKARSTDVTHTVQGTPKANTYQSGLDQSGTYKSTIEFTIVSK